MYGFAVLAEIPLTFGKAFPILPDERGLISNPPHALPPEAWMYAID
jgi:hypothetical protein